MRIGILTVLAHQFYLGNRRKKKRVSERIMYIIRPETLSNSWDETSRQRVSDQIICMTLDETRFTREDAVTFLPSNS